MLVLAVKILQIVVSVILVLLVLIQGKGGGLSSTFGGSFTMYRSKRGAEKVIFVFTIFLAIVLIVNSLMLISLT
jgi:preprotein translocase subunit SecG